MSPSFKINEIFYSLQGEGFFSGVPAVFIRFSGCNLRCPFCDTEHTTGNAMTFNEIVDEVRKYPAPLIVLTGGEPALFVTRDFIALLKNETGKFIAIETNGTMDIPDNIDWITLSPKFEFSPEQSRLTIKKCNELKVIFQNQDLSVYDNIEAEHRFLQPCDSGNPHFNQVMTQKAVEACLKDPHWRLSLQTHKFLGIK